MPRLKLVSLAIFVLLTTFTLAQSVATGDLRVTVKDPSAKLVTNATVTASDQAKGLERQGTGNGEGEYRVLVLPPGTYKVTVEAPGFAKLSAENVIITVGQVVDLPVTLSVAGTQEVVNVSSSAELVETQRTSSTDTIEQRRIDNLPINGRNYINFTLTDSQAVRDNAPNIGAASTSGINMSGQRARSNLVNVDGADAIDNSTNGVRSTVSQEAVQEFQIINNNYAAEYGRAAGGVVNIITRSGSNDFHGDVYGYLRNRNFQAVNPFSTTSNPAYTRVQAGAAFGGPIKKDKTYYYFSYEITRRHETGFTSIGQDGFGLASYDVSPFFAPLLPPGAVTGPLNILATSGAQCAPNCQVDFFNQAKATLGTLPAPVALQLDELVVAYATQVGAASGVGVNGAYPSWFALVNPLIPGPGVGVADPLHQFFSSCNLNPLDPASSNLLCHGLPATFAGLASQGQNFPVFEGTSVYSLRLDHNLTNTNRLMLRANVSPSTVTGIEVNGENQVFGQNSFSRTSEQTYRDVAGVAQDTWTIGNNKVNQFSFQYARRGLSYFFSSSPGGSSPAVNVIGEAFIGREPYSYIRRTEQRYQFTDNFAWTIGRHDTKFGADFNYIPVKATFTVNYGGNYDFGPISTTLPNLQTTFGLPFTFPGLSATQAYGLGIPQTLVQGIGNPNDSFSNKPLGIYWQDSWRVRPSLTLNYGVRYDVEFPPKFAAPDTLGLAAYDALGIQKGIQTDGNNVQPRIGVAWDPRGNGKSVLRASYGMFYDHPLLGLYFLGDASDGSKSGQLLFFGAAPCNPAVGPPAGLPFDPGNVNASNIFQGILTTTNCVPNYPQLGYQQTSSDGTANPQRFDPFNANSFFINQAYLNPAAPFPLVSQPFGYPQAKNFVYAYSQQANLTFEQDLGRGFALSVAYNFNGGRHLNRPINANTARGDLLVKNWQAAVAASRAAQALGLPVSTPSNPLAVAICPSALGGIAPAGPYAPAAMLSFFRPSGLNPALAGGPCLGDAVALAKADGLGLGAGGSACDPTLPFGSSGACVLIPFSDMDANYSNGSSIYHGFTASLRKRFSDHYEFLASYTFSHAIDDSTDLQSPLSPQDSYFPGLERSNSLFDQRHRFVFSAVYQSGKVAGDSWTSKLLSNWTVAPIIDVASGRPFNILTGSADNLQFSPFTSRPTAVPVGTPTNSCGYSTVASKFSRSGALQEVCFADVTPAQLASPDALLALDGTLGRNAGVQPWTVFNDLRVARRLYFGERVSLDMIADMFNIANRFNVAAVNQLYTLAGQPTAAYDPRQFQFALKVNW